MTINRYSSTWFEDLQESLNHLHDEHPDTRIYALIEGVHCESSYPWLKRSTGLPYFSLYANTSCADEEILSMSPILVEYRTDAQDTWKTLLQKTDGRPALSLIATPESLSDLARRLTPWCVVDAAGYTMALSFADTRILPELFKVLSPVQRQQLCGPMLRWQYVTREATWDTLPLPVTPLPAAHEVKLDEKQCACLTDAAEADNVLFQLRSHARNIVDCHSPARAHALIRHWLACADHAQIASSPERVEMCEFGLSRPWLEQAPEISMWLATPSSPQSFHALRQQWLAACSIHDDQ